jgi:putative transcriptional regulator
VFGPEPKVVFPVAGELNMPIIVNLDVMLARRKMRLGELSERVDVSLANLSILKTGKAKAIRFSTLAAICRALDCQPGDILEYQDGPSEESAED